MQAGTGLAFDLVVCDEAHRTTGVASSSGEDESAFALRPRRRTSPGGQAAVHDRDTPRSVQARRSQGRPRRPTPSSRRWTTRSSSATEFHRLGFGEAVEQGCSPTTRSWSSPSTRRRSSQTFQRPAVDATASSASTTSPGSSAAGTAWPSFPAQQVPSFTGDEPPMQRAVAFWSKIKDSKRFAQQFEQVTEATSTSSRPSRRRRRSRPLAVPTDHVDGTIERSAAGAPTSAGSRTPPGQTSVRVLTNARCLTEGVDVPALDAVMFLTPAQIDGRHRPGRRPGDAQAAGQAVRLHHPARSASPPARPRSGAATTTSATTPSGRSSRRCAPTTSASTPTINRIALGSTKPGPARRPDQGHPRRHQRRTTTSPPTSRAGCSSYEEWPERDLRQDRPEGRLAPYWEDWARDVADIAARHETRITRLLDQPDRRRRRRSRSSSPSCAPTSTTASPATTRSTMLSQHLITRPSSTRCSATTHFGQRQPGVAGDERDGRRPRPAQPRDRDRARSTGSTTRSAGGSRASTPTTAKPASGSSPSSTTVLQDRVPEGRRLPRHRLHARSRSSTSSSAPTEAALAEHFDGASLTDEGVHVLDPFTGTGTFIIRLLQSGFIRPDDLARKYADELHANEILLLAYYIAAVNIETTYRQERARAHGGRPGLRAVPRHRPHRHVPARRGRRRHRHLGRLPGEQRARRPPEGPRHPRHRRQPALLGGPGVSQRRQRQPEVPTARRAIAQHVRQALDGDAQEQPLRLVHPGHPVGSTGCSTRRTAASSRSSPTAAASTRTPPTACGSRSPTSSTTSTSSTCAATSAPPARCRDKEGGKIFDCRQPRHRGDHAAGQAARRSAAGGATLHYRDIGDYLSRDEKLDILAERSADSGRRTAWLDDLDWTAITPNEHGDWIDQRSESFQNLARAGVTRGPVGLRAPHTRPQDEPRRLELQQLPRGARRQRDDG